MSVYTDVAKKFGFRVLLSVLAGVLIILYVRTAPSDKGELAIISVNEHQESLQSQVQRKLFPDLDHEPVNIKTDQTIVALEFLGDATASRSKYLATDVTAILNSPSPISEVVVSIQSGGGAVHEYGYASSQLMRLTDKGIKLTACVDKVAASGGYMMAASADKIIAAPFALLGSIGVVAEIPNINKLLKSHGVEVDVLTAGDYKRTLTMIGENTDKAREKVKMDLAKVHGFFKDYVGKNRSGIDINKVSNGDVWYGQEAIELGLIDRVATCEEYIMEKSQVANVFKFEHEGVKGITQSLGEVVSSAISKGISDSIRSVLKESYFSL